MDTFTPWTSLAGGAVIGLSAALLLLLQGRVAGISGIFGSLFRPAAGEFAWRLMFVAGLLAGGLGAWLLAPAALAVTVDRSWIAVGVAGLLVGFGTRLGSGCTSGHGVCGISRLSPRSLVATGSFTFAGAVVVLVVTHLLGGQV